MNAVKQQAEAEGIQFILAAGGKLKARGESETINKWLPTIREHKKEILFELERDLHRLPAWCTTWPAFGMRR